MTAMLHGLVGSVADDLRVHLPEELALMTECDTDVLVTALGQARLLSSDALIGLLVRSADSARVAQAATQHGAAGKLLMSWSGDEDSDLAAAAMAVVVARGRSRDRFGRPGLILADCPADLAVDLVHAVAAALAMRCSGSADEPLAGAANDLLSRHDEGGRVEALEARLVRLLEAAGKFEPGLVLALARAGEAGLLAESLARMAGISGEDGWCLAVQPGGKGLPWLLRLAGQPRDVAAALFVNFGEAFGISDPAQAIDQFDAVSNEAAEDERRRLRLPASYRSALEALNHRG